MRSDADPATIMERCGIPPSGELHGFTFVPSGSYYWIVQGALPLEVALRLYDDPVGRSDIRVTGHCACPPPEDPWITWRTPDGREVVPSDQEEGLATLASKGLISDRYLDQFVFTDDRSEAIGTIDLYHIDTEVGLRLFVDTIKETHGPRLPVAGERYMIEVEILSGREPWMSVDYPAAPYGPELDELDGDRLVHVEYNQGRGLNGHEFLARLSHLKPQAKNE